MYARQLGASIELPQHELPHLAVDIFERRDLFIVDVPLVRIRRIPHFDLLLSDATSGLALANGLFGKSAFSVTCMQASYMYTETGIIPILSEHNSEHPSGPGVL
jgi:hypothetical protein